MTMVSKLTAAAVAVGLMAAANAASAATITFANLAQTDIPAPEASFAGGLGGGFSNAHPYTGLFTLTLKSGFVPTTYNNVSIKLEDGFTVNSFGTKSGSTMIQPLAGGNMRFIATQGTASTLDDVELLVGAVGNAQVVIYNNPNSTGSVLSSTDITWSGLLTSQFNAAGLSTNNGSFSLSLVGFNPAAVTFSTAIDLGTVQLGYIDSFTASVTGALDAAPGGGDIIPTPAAAWAGLSLLGGLGAFGAARRRMASRSAL